MRERPGERMGRRERERESRERERKGKSMNLSSPFMSMASFIFLVFAFSCGAYLIRMKERLKFRSFTVKTDLIQQYAKQKNWNRAIS
jgi:hypothetical protein